MSFLAPSRGCFVVPHSVLCATMATVDSLPSLVQRAERKESYDEKLGSDSEKIDTYSVENSVHVDVWDDLTAEGKEKPIGVWIGSS